MKKDPYQIVKHQYVTEKSQMLESLKNANSNASLARCKSPKYVFIVDTRANKQEIAWAVKEIYPEIDVMAVNTINVKPKQRRVRGRIGATKSFKKAVVTLKEGDSLDTI